MPGTSRLRLKKTKQDLIEALEQTDYQFNDLKLVNDGYSMFPYFFKQGENGYNRLKSIPSTGVSTLKAASKRGLLDFMASQSGLEFIEVDIKSCHTVVARRFLREIGVEIPPIQKHWSSLIEDFQKYRKNLTEDNFIVREIKRWDDEKIKNVVKPQWYKGLNAGRWYDPYDCLEDSHVKLEIERAEIGYYSDNIKEIMKQIKLLKGLGKLQERLNKHAYIYLPSDPEPFNTNTLSKAQEADQ